MNYRKLSDSELLGTIRTRFPRATLARITAKNRRILIELLKDYDKRKRRERQCTARR